MITSSSNQQMKNITALMKKAKERKSQNLFVVEGRKMFEEVPPEWLSKIYVSERFLEESEVEQLLAGKTYEVVADAVFPTYRHRRGSYVWCACRSTRFPICCAGTGHIC
mgnify:CR=1 FL=1